jgi:hypothetical protein
MSNIKQNIKEGITECITCHFYNVFVCYLYENGKKYYNNDRCKTITEGYRVSLEEYLNSRTSPEFYRTTMRSISISIQKYLYPGANMVNCEKLILQSYYPTNAYKLIENDIALIKKHTSNLFNVLTQHISNYVLRNLQTIIVNGNSMDAKIEIKKNINIIISEVESVLYAKYQKNINVHKNENYENEDYVLRNLKEECKVLLQQKMELTTKVTNYEEVILQMNKHIENLQQELENLKSRYEDQSELKRQDERQNREKQNERQNERQNRESENARKEAAKRFKEMREAERRESERRESERRESERRESERRESERRESERRESERRESERRESERQEAENQNEQQIKDKFEELENENEDEDDDDKEFIENLKPELDPRSARSRMLSLANKI